MCRNDTKIEKQGAWIATKEKVKIYLKHSQKNSKYYICLVFLNGKFRTQLNMRDEAFLQLG